MRTFFIVFCINKYFDVVVAHYTYIGKEESTNAQKYFKYIGKSSFEARSVDPKYLFDDELTCIKICDSNRETCKGIDIVEEGSKLRCTFVADSGLLKDDQDTTHVTRKTVNHMFLSCLGIIRYLRLQCLIFFQIFREDEFFSKCIYPPIKGCWKQ